MGRLCTPRFVEEARPESLALAEVVNVGLIALHIGMDEIEHSIIRELDRGDYITAYNLSTKRISSP